MKRTPTFVLLVGSGVLFAVVAGYLYLTRESRPVTGCYPVDHGTRSRYHCLMNPFRDRAIEREVEELLTLLQSGEVHVLVPLLAGSTQDEIDRVLENETKYSMSSWQVGEYIVESSEAQIKYWVKRENYDSGEEEVTVYLNLRDGAWEVTGYSAIY
jgi:hypothetical protein